MKIKFLDQSELLFDNGMRIDCDYYGTAMGVYFNGELKIGVDGKLID